ncbi:hypothetical protein DFH06DRAFT_581170 [Mycena polygramma]|nr:hypothetical protein DFH06DRAFT_581170 [Mycena polygramma]
MATGQRSSLLLPPEIVALIFEYCLPSHTWHAWSPQDSGPNDHLWPSPNKAPLLLAQICGRWREICLNTPSLWRSIAFGEGGSLDLLETWLLRAGNQPLRIFLQSRDDTRADALMRNVKPHSSRWQEVHFALPASAHQQLDLMAFPCLERLTLVTPDEAGPSIVIQQAPSLRHAEIIRLPYFTAHLALQQLTSLTLYSQATPVMIVAVLRCCPNLLALDTGSTWTLTTLVPSEAPLQLHFLRSLKVPEPTLLHCLTAPRLKQLQILITMGSRCDALQLFLARSCCDLQSLTSKLLRTNADQTRQIFRVVPTVTHLHLHFKWVSDFNTQIQVLQGVDILPRLERLEIRIGPAVVVGDYAPLLEMLGRRRGASGLESFELVVDTRSRPPAPVMDGFRALAAAGLQLRVITDDSDLNSIDVLLDTSIEPHVPSFALEK